MNNYALKEYQIKRKMEGFAIHAGYLPYESQLLEEYDEFETNEKLVTEQLVTLHTDSGLKLLRPDMTTSIMNKVIPNLKTGESLKLFYQSPVFRKSDGEIKIINQFGIESLGLSSAQLEKEVLDLAIAYLEDEQFILEIGNTKFIQQLVDRCRFSAKDEKIFRKLIYIKNKEELLRFAHLKEVPQELNEVLSQLFTLRGNYREVAAQCETPLLKELTQTALADMAYLKDYNGTITLDLSSSSPFTYYDGIIFKGYYRQAPRAVLSGGRYGQTAMGFTIDVDSWLSCQKKEGSKWLI